MGDWLRIALLTLPVWCWAAASVQGQQRVSEMAQAADTQQEAQARKDVEIAAARYGEARPEYAAALRSLAGALTESRPHAAEELLRRALAIDEATYGPDDPRVAVNANELGVLLTDTNRFAEAEPLLRRALLIDVRTVGENHRNVAADLFNLGVLLRRTRRFAEAEPVLYRALALEEKNFGPSHPRVAGVLIDLALLLKASNREPEAVQLEKRVRATTIKNEAVTLPPKPTPKRQLDEKEVWKRDIWEKR